MSRNYTRSPQLPAGILLAGEPWRLLAACRDHPTLHPNTWDDSLQDGTEPPQRRAKRIKAAIAVCQTCPVKAECWEAVDLRYDEGIRAGVDLRQVKRAAAQREKAARELPPDDPRHGTQNGYGNFGCRCAACVAANSDRLKVQRARRKAS